MDIDPPYYIHCFPYKQTNQWAFTCLPGATLSPASPGGRCLLSCDFSLPATPKEDSLCGKVCITFLIIRTLQTPRVTHFVRTAKAQERSKCSDPSTSPDDRNTMLCSMHAVKKNSVTGSMDQYRKSTCENTVYMYMNECVCVLRQFFTCLT